MKYISLIALFVLLFSACGNNSSSSKEKDQISTSNSKEFVFPDIPTVLTTPKQRAEYLAIHYWDKFSFKDTAYLHLPDVTEQAVVNFIDVISRIDSSIAAKSISVTFNKAKVEPKMLSYFWNTFNRYLDDPNSPMRNESLYIMTCKAIKALNNVNESITANASFKLNMVLKNRLGEKAADFSFTDSKGKYSRMYSVKSDYLILMFYDPECETCSHAKKFLRESSLINSMLSSGKIKILAFYPDDDLQTWKDKGYEIPSSWINACDKKQQLRADDSYDLRAMPTLYLLDKNKRVLLKDVTPENIESFLQNK